MIGGLKDHATHDRLADLCEQLGLPSPGTEGSKRDRLYASIDGTPDADLAGIAKVYLLGFARDTATRKEIQELVWALSPSPEVPVRFRREVAQALEGELLYLKANAFMELLESLFILEDPFDFFTTQVRRLGLEELFDRPALVLVEWGERFPELFPPDHIEIRLTHTGDDDRHITITDLVKHS